MEKNSKVGEKQVRAPALDTSGLLGVDDVAELLRTTPRQIRNMRSKGQLPPAVKWPGLGVRWVASKLHQWIAEQSQQSSAC